MLYLDPSLVVSLVTAEGHTAQAQDWLEDQEPDQLVVSDWVVTEVASALSIKRRTGQIDDVTHARVSRAFDELARDAFSVLPVPRSAFVAAAAMAGRPEVGLRSGDALHLATADHHGARLCTRDARQAEAGNRLGLDVFLLGDTT